MLCRKVHGGQKKGNPQAYGESGCKYPGFSEPVYGMEIQMGYGKKMADDVGSRKSEGNLSEGQRILLTDFEG